MYYIYLYKTYIINICIYPSVQFVWYVIYIPKKLFIKKKGKGTSSQAMEGYVGTLGYIAHERNQPKEALWV